MAARLGTWTCAWLLMLAGAAPLSAQPNFPSYQPTTAPSPAPTLVDPSPVYQAQTGLTPQYQAVPPYPQTPPYPQAEVVPTPTPIPSQPPIPTRPAMPTYTPHMASRMPEVPTLAPPQHSATHLPGYGSGVGGPAYAQSMPPMYEEVPTATYDRQNFPPYGTYTGPHKYKQWMPTYSVPLGHHARAMFGPHGAPYPCCDPECQPGYCGDPGRWYDNLCAFTEMNAFQGPLDLDGLNGNFGVRAGVQGAIPVSREWGLGIQAGGSQGYYDWKGTQYTGDGARVQTFMTAGVFQRFASTGIGYAVVYDWLMDDYYHDFFFGQWRGAVSWQSTGGNEIGCWIAGPDRRDEAFVGTPAVRNDFSSIIQGNVFWRHMWSQYASTTIFGGLAESPSNIPFGASAQVAMNDYLALTGGFEYILPSSGGADGRQEEVWAVSFGVAFYPGSAARVTQSQFRPFLPLADNGNFAIRRH